MSFLYSLFIIIATSILTAMLSFWRYRSERWWELKVTTYSKIMESLHYIKQNAVIECDNYFENQAPPDKHDDEIIKMKIKPETIEIFRNKSESAILDIQKIIDVNSFIIPQAALSELKKLQDKLNSDFHIDELSERLTEEEKLIKNCISNIGSIAKDDIETIPEKISIKLQTWFKG